MLETGTLIPGESGPLLWDEPETNLNPSLMRALVEIIIKLARGGQQIILTTHSYVLLKWFKIILEGDNSVKLFYHHLYREDDFSDIRALTTEVYNEILENSIGEAYDSLIGYQIQKEKEIMQNGAS